MGAGNIDSPPPSDDPPPPGHGTSPGRSDAGPHRDEATAGSDAAVAGRGHSASADSPGNGETAVSRPVEKPPESARDEAHALRPGLADNLVRTGVNTGTEAVLRGEVDVAALALPPRENEYDFADKPGQMRAEGLADVPERDPWNNPNTPLGRAAAMVEAPLSVSPADEAATAQGDLTHYPGTDEWTNDVAPKGTRVWFGSHELPPGEGGPAGDQRFAGKRGFGVAEGNLHNGWQEVALDATLYNEGAQVEPYQGTYRKYLDCYEFTRDTPVATGVATENTGHGDGGTPQMYVPNVKKMIADGSLRYVGTAKFETGTKSSDRVRR